MFQATWFKEAFNIWERTTMAYLDGLARNPAFLGASGAGVTLKKMADMGGQWYLAWLGLPTRRDQERTLHLLQQIEGRIDDLQLKLESWRREREPAKTEQH